MHAYSSTTYGGTPYFTRVRCKRSIALAAEQRAKPTQLAEQRRGINAGLVRTKKMMQPPNEPSPQEQDIIETVIKETLGGRSGQLDMHYAGFYKFFLLLLSSLDFGWEVILSF